MHEGFVSENGVKLAISESERRTDAMIAEIRLEIRDGFSSLDKKLGPLWVQVRKNEKGVKETRDTAKTVTSPPSSSPRPSESLKWRNRIWGAVAGALLVACILEPGLITGTLATVSGAAVAVSKIYASGKP